ncbi:MAG TPA: PAS domain-containing sensor histidine kinase, partial [Nitrospirota bacterium]|nr:PAS domain-containing sensor histidine kinase [Nitrospirota bacterium]
VRKDGAAIYVETHISAVIFRGRPAFMGRVTDITERKMYEQQRADFYAMLTHDIKSPLTTIMGYAELIKLKQGEAGRDVVEMAGYIEEGGEKLIRMVEEFLAVSRIESGKIAFKKTEVHVAALLAKIHRDFGAQARKKGLELNLDAAGGPAVAVLDKMYVEMAVSNLVQNAVNYTPAGGRITIKAENAPGGEGLLAISVTDSGPGIPAEALGRVFEKYYRVPGSGVKGSGLGLAVVKMVAEAHGGSIEMECPEGGGCTFTMVLPVGPGPGA